MLVKSSGRVMLLSELQLLNALSPIVFTLLGMTQLSRRTQLLNVEFSILVTPLGMVILVRFLQEEKRLLPRVVTVEGREMLLRL